MRASTSSAGEASIDLIISVSTRPYCRVQFQRGRGADARSCQRRALGVETTTRSDLTARSATKVPIALIDQWHTARPNRNGLETPAARSKDGEQFNDTRTLLVGG